MRFTQTWDLPARLAKDRLRWRQHVGFLQVQRAAALPMESVTSGSPAVPRAGHSRSRRSTSMERSFSQGGEDLIRQENLFQTCSELMEVESTTRIAGWLRYAN